jgi:hypothetical protein
MANSDMTAAERDMLAVAEAVGVVAPPPAPAWRTSRRSGTRPQGNCVQVAAIPPAGGVCHCGGDPDCRICHGTGTVWL